MMDLINIYSIINSTFVSMQKTNEVLQSLTLKFPFPNVTSPLNYPSPINFSVFFFSWNLWSFQRNKALKEQVFSFAQSFSTKFVLSLSCQQINACLGADCGNQINFHLFSIGVLYLTIWVPKLMHKLNNLTLYAPKPPDQIHQKQPQAACSVCLQWSSYLAGVHDGTG